MTARVIFIGLDAAEIHLARTLGRGRLLPLAVLRDGAWRHDPPVVSARDAARRGVARNRLQHGLRPACAFLPRPAAPNRRGGQARDRARGGRYGTLLLGPREPCRQARFRLRHPSNRACAETSTGCNCSNGARTTAISRLHQRAAVAAGRNPTRRTATTRSAACDSHGETH